MKIVILEMLTDEIQVYIRMKVFCNMLSRNCMTVQPTAVLRLAHVTHCKDLRSGRVSMEQRIEVKYKAFTSSISIKKSQKSKKIFTEDG